MFNSFAGTCPHGQPGVPGQGLGCQWIARHRELAVRGRLIVAQLLGTAELRQRDRPAMFHAGNDLVEPTTAIVRGWASPLGKPVGVAFEMTRKPAEMGPPNVCSVVSCTHASGSRVLHGGVGVVLCATHVAGQRVGSSVKSAGLSDWSALCLLFKFEPGDHRWVLAAELGSSSMRDLRYRHQGRMYACGE